MLSNSSININSITQENDSFFSEFILADEATFNFELFTDLFHCFDTIKSTIDIKNQKFNVSARSIAKHLKMAYEEIQGIIKKLGFSEFLEEKKIGSDSNNIALNFEKNNEILKEIKKISEKLDNRKLEKPNFDGLEETFSAKFEELKEEIKNLNEVREGILYPETGIEEKLASLMDEIRKTTQEKRENKGDYDQDHLLNEIEEVLKTNLVPLEVIMNQTTQEIKSLKSEMEKEFLMVDGTLENLTDIEANHFRPMRSRGGPRKFRGHRRAPEEGDCDSKDTSKIHDDFPSFPPNLIRAHPPRGRGRRKDRFHHH